MPIWSGPPLSALDPYTRPWTLALAQPDPLCSVRETCAQCLTNDPADQVRWQWQGQGAVPSTSILLTGGFAALMNIDDFACYQTYAQYATAAAGGGASAVLIYYTSREADPFDLLAVAAPAADGSWERVAVPTYSLGNFDATRLVQGTPNSLPPSPLSPSLSLSLLHCWACRVTQSTPPIPFPSRSGEQLPG